MLLKCCRMWLQFSTVQLCRAKQISNCTHCRRQMSNLTVLGNMLLCVLRHDFQKYICSGSYKSVLEVLNDWEIASSSFFFVIYLFIYKYSLEDISHVEAAYKWIASLKWAGLKYFWKYFAHFFNYFYKSYTCV